MSGPVRPLVGRERELELVEQLLDHIWDGDARFLFIAGEPGIGKTRLLPSSSDEPGNVAA